MCIRDRYGGVGCRLFRQLLLEPGNAGRTGSDTSDFPVADVFLSLIHILNLSISKEKLLLYRVSYNELYRVLKTAFRENSVTMLHSYQQYLPINIAGNEKTAVSYTHLRMATGY